MHSIGGGFISLSVISDRSMLRHGFDVVGVSIAASLINTGLIPFELNAFTCLPLGHGEGSIRHGPMPCLEFDSSRLTRKPHLLDCHMVSIPEQYAALSCFSPVCASEEKPEPHRILDSSSNRVRSKSRACGAVRLKSLGLLSRAACGDYPRQGPRTDDPRTSPAKDPKLQPRTAKQSTLA